MGTSALAVGAGLVLFLMREAFAIRREGWAVVQKRWRGDAGFGALLTVGLWACLFLWCMAQAIYQDHNNLVITIQRISKERDELKKQHDQMPNTQSDSGHVQSIRNSLASFINGGTKLRDRIPLGDDTAGTLQPEVKEWRDTVFRYLSKNLDAADAATFASYEVKGYPENYNLMQQIGALEDLLKQPKLRP
jgi:hypothetical protein